MNSPQRLLTLSELFDELRHASRIQFVKEIVPQNAGH
jgi:hypothetical protein